MGSAIAQKRIPTAVVVHKVMLAQLIGDKKGFALGPPSRMDANGEKKMITQMSRTARPVHANVPEKLLSIALFKSVEMDTNFFESQQLRASVSAMSKMVGQKTECLMFLFI